jgi:hypothetical protein
MMAMFRYIYDVRYYKSTEAGDDKLQTLATIYLVADKYDVDGLQESVIDWMESVLQYSTERDIQARKPKPNDFLAATKLIFNGTVKQDDICRQLLIKFCVLCIRDLKKLPEFATLLSEHADLGAGILAQENLNIMLEGSWYCDGDEHKFAVPCCPNIYCETTFPMWYLLDNYRKKLWKCPVCQEEVTPVCCEHGDDRGLECEWSSLLE